MSNITSSTSIKDKKDASVKSTTATKATSQIDDNQSVDTQATNTTGSSITNASPEVQQVKGTIKEWLSIDNAIAKCDMDMREIRNKKKELVKKKEGMTGRIIDFMEEHDVPFFNTTNDKIELVETKRKKGLSKGVMFDLMNKYFNNDSTKATDAVNFINENREVSTHNKLRRKKKKQTSTQHDIFISLTLID